MKPKIVEKNGFILLGMRYDGKNENDEISMLWHSFLERLNEIKNRVDSNESYGYDTWTEKINETGEFTYIAGVEVKDASTIPEGMTCIKIPDNKYAVFTMASTIEDVGKTVSEIYRKWLPESGLELCDSYDFEYYNEDFKHNDENSKLYFYVPIK